MCEICCIHHWHITRRRVESYAYVCDRSKSILHAHRGVMCICESFKMCLFVSICVLCLCLYIGIYRNSYVYRKSVDLGVLCLFRN